MNEHGHTADDYKQIIVIPGVGCSSCITQAEAFFERNHTDTQILFIFTIIDDLKIFKQTIPRAMSLNNVIVDSDNDLYYMGFYSQYPHEFLISEDEYINTLLFGSSEVEN